jgi:hypothetical protein
MRTTARVARAERKLGLVQAANAWDPQGAAAFPTFAHLYIRRRVMDASRRAGYQPPAETKLRPRG